MITESRLTPQDKVVDREIQEIDNQIITLEIRRRVLLSQKSICISCGLEKELPPALNGICGSCEMWNFDNE